MSGTGSPGGRWLAILTGAISILIGVLYLVLIAVLDSRGPLQPPPPEAMLGSAAGSKVPLTRSVVGEPGSAALPAGAAPPG